MYKKSGTGSYWTNFHPISTQDMVIGLKNFMLPCNNDYLQFPHFAMEQSHIVRKNVTSAVGGQGQGVIDF